MNIEMDLPAQVVIWVIMLLNLQCNNTGLLQYTSQYLMVALNVGHCLVRVDRPRIINDLLFLFFFNATCNSAVSHLAY